MWEVCDGYTDIGDVRLYSWAPKGCQLTDNSDCLLADLHALVACCRGAAVTVWLGAKSMQVTSGLTALPA